MIRKDGWGEERWIMFLKEMGGRWWFERWGIKDDDAEMRMGKGSWGAAGGRMDQLFLNNRGVGTWQKMM